MIKPGKLKRGDTVATISLSWGGPAVFPQRYLAGKTQLEAEFGLHVVETRHALRDPEWLAHHPQARAEDLMEAFADPTISAIISTIGGDDSLRILPFLDLAVIHANPKIFIGFSDTTVTHFACFKAGLCSFYGPALLSGFAENGGMFPYLVDSIQRTLFSPEPVGLIKPDLDGWVAEEYQHWGEPGSQEIKRNLHPSPGWHFLHDHDQSHDHQVHGVKRGHLLGGCLEVLDLLRGSKVWPSTAEWQGAILFFETFSAETTPKTVVQFLRALAALDILSGLAGIIFGRPGGSVSTANFARYDAAILQVVVQEEGLTDLPIITGMGFGHTDPVFILPYGVLAEIDCLNQEFRIVESALLERPS